MQEELPQKEKISHEIALELDMIGALSKLTIFALEQEAQILDFGCVNLVLQDIENRTWRISELIGKL